MLSKFRFFFVNDFYVFVFFVPSAKFIILFSIFSCKKRWKINHGLPQSVSLFLLYILSMLSYLFKIKTTPSVPSFDLNAKPGIKLYVRVLPFKTLGSLQQEKNKYCACVQRSHWYICQYIYISFSVACAVRRENTDFDRVC